MKKILLIFSLLFCVTININAQTDIKVCGYFDDYWSDWKPGSGAAIRGNYDGFIIYRQKDGPWEYRFKFKIDNMSFPNKEQREIDIKANKWYQFSGTVEYYIAFQFTSALEIFRWYKGPYFCPPGDKITSRATIKIAPFKDYPKVYTIFYDNVGFGIDLGSTKLPIDPLPLPSKD